MSVLVYVCEDGRRTKEAPVVWTYYGKRAEAHSKRESLGMELGAKLELKNLVNKNPIIVCNCNTQTLLVSKGQYPLNIRIHR